MKTASELIAFMDVDIAVGVEHLNLLLEPILEGDAGISTGSRYREASEAERFLAREVLSIG